MNYHRIKERNERKTTITDLQTKLKEVEVELKDGLKAHSIVWGRLMKADVKLSEAMKVVEVVRKLQKQHREFIESDKAGPFTYELGFDFDRLLLMALPAEEEEER